MSAVRGKKPTNRRLQWRDLEQRYSATSSKMENTSLAYDLQRKRGMKGRFEEQVDDFQRLDERVGKMSYCFQTAYCLLPY